MNGLNITKNKIKLKEKIEKDVQAFVCFGVGLMKTSMLA